MVDQEASISSASSFVYHKNLETINQTNKYFKQFLKRANCTCIGIMQVKLKLFEMWYTSHAIYIIALAKSIKNIFIPKHIKE